MFLPVVYRFVSVWNVPFASPEVWPFVRQLEQWRDWWPGMTRSQSLTPSHAGIGSRSAFCVRGVLPYRLRYQTTLIRIDRSEQLHFEVTGDVIGNCRIAIANHDNGCDVLTFWDVQTSRRWPAVVHPFLRWLFAWNHHRALLSACRGLVSRLTANRLAVVPVPSRIIAQRLSLDGLPQRSSSERTSTTVRWADNHPSR